MKYRFDMTETRSFSVTYTVEADSIEEAREKAAIGDTVEEEETRAHGVQDRDIFEERGEVTDDEEDGDDDSSDPEPSTA